MKRSVIPVITVILGFALLSGAYGGASCIARCSQNFRACMKGADTAKGVARKAERAKCNQAYDNCKKDCAVPKSPASEKE